MTELKLMKKDSRDKRIRWKQGLHKSNKTIKIKDFIQLEVTIK